MHRNDTINKLLAIAGKDQLHLATQQLAQPEPHNYLLQLLNMAFSTTADPTSNWFTAFGLLCIYQKKLAGHILQLANTASGHPLLKAAAKKQILDAVAAGSKLTRADAG